MQKTLAISLYACLFLAEAASSAIPDLDRLLNHTLRGYTKNYLPNVNASAGDALDVDVNIYVISINEFNEISGEVEMTVSFDFQWQEDRIRWAQSDYGGIKNVLLPSDTVWKPDIFLFNAADKMVKAGQEEVLVRINNTGKAQWRAAQVIKFTCGVNVEFYPFDSQTCDINFISWSYDTDEVQLRDSGERLKLKYYIESSQWEFLSSSFRPGLFENKSYLRYQFKLKRRPSYFIVYIISPIIILGLLSTLVFVIPYSSGERLSVAMTAVLSFVVFMEIINSNVPGNSDPVAAIFFYLLFLLIQSSISMILLVISHRVHDKTGSVYKPVERLTNVLRFQNISSCKKCLQYSSNKIDASKYNGTESPDANAKDEKTDVEINDSDEITWTVVGDTLDGYFFVFMLLTYCFISLGFLLAIYLNSF